MGLTKQQVDDFSQQGFVTPVTVFSEIETRQMRNRLEQFERDFADQAAGMRTDLHLLEQWAWDVVHDPRIL